VLWRCAPRLPGWGLVTHRGGPSGSGQVA